MDKIFKVFNLKQYSIDYNKKNALVLTQRFSTYGMLNQEECILMYALLCDFFAKDCKIYLKPHPADKCKYDEVFREQVVLEKEMPSELIRFIIKKNFDVGISTYSSSINSLKNYINHVYNMDDSIINFKNNIFKLYAIFEIANNFDGNVIVKDELLDRIFEECYNLNNKKGYIFNYSDVEKENTHIIKDYYFSESNCIIKINKEIENQDMSNELLNKTDVLYMRINNEKFINKLINFKFDKVLSISKVHITIQIENIN